MNNFVYILLIAANGWGMVDSLSKGHGALACLNAFVLGLLTLGIIVKNFVYNR